MARRDVRRGARARLTGATPRPTDRSARRKRAWQDTTCAARAIQRALSRYLGTIYYGKRKADLQSCYNNLHVQ